MGIVFMACGLAAVQIERNSMDRLRELVLYDPDAAQGHVIENEEGLESEAFIGSDSIDWNALEEIDSNAETWLQVTGCGISTCVMSTTEDTASWWLTHDAWGNLNSIGCPYFDWRCTADSPASYVYGHHLTNEAQGFSPLASVSSQDDLTSLGIAILAAQGSEKIYRPAYWLVVEESYLYLRYVPDRSQFSDWLSHIADDATYAVANMDETDYSEALVLVTCSNVLPGPKQRVATVFVR
jgi:sortase B